MYMHVHVHACMCLILYHRNCRFKGGKELAISELEHVYIIIFECTFTGGGFVCAIIR